MKKIFSVFILLAFSSIAQSKKPSVIKCIVPSAHIPPFVIGDGPNLSKPNPGMTVENIETLFKTKLKTEVQFERLPYSRMTDSMSTGQYDCTVSLDIQTVSADGRITHFHQVPLKKNGDIDTSKSFSTSNLNIYYNSDFPVIWDGKKLMPNVEVYSPIKEFNSIGEHKGLKIIEENPDILRQLKQLQMGRIQAIMSLDILADSLIKHEKISNIKKNETPIMTIKNYLVFSKQFYQKYPDFCEQTWSQLKKYRKSKEFKSIQEKYLKSIK